MAYSRCGKQLIDAQGAKLLTARIVSAAAAQSVRLDMMDFPNNDDDDDDKIPSHRGHPPLTLWVTYRANFPTGAASVWQRGAAAAAAAAAHLTPKWREPRNLSGESRAQVCTHIFVTVYIIIVYIDWRKL